MTSTKPLIALRLPHDMHARLCQLAAAEDRTPANFIEHALRGVLGAQVKPVFVPAAQSRQIDISEQIARKVEQGPGPGKKHALTRKK